MVLTATREGRPKGKEPTGEPESLAGRRLRKMGDRAAQSAPDELTELKKRKPKCAPLRAAHPLVRGSHIAVHHASAPAVLM